MQTGQKKRLRLLVTGFGPFPGVADNPSAWLVRRLRRAGFAAAHTGVTPAFAVFPTEWGALPRVHALTLSRTRPDLVVHFGVSACARAFHIEALARNHADGRADARGHQTSASMIAPRAPEVLETSLPVGKIVARLQGRGLPARASDDAGGYICNMTYFLTLALGLRGLSTPVALFVHIPPFEAGALTPGQLLAGARAVISQAIYQAREYSAPARCRHTIVAPDLLS